MDMPKMVRTFHPVGHGAFYTERFYDDNGENTANVVFDCGCFEACKAGISPKVFEQRIKTTIQKEFCKDTKIDALFISHFHTDHINGIDELLNYCQVTNLYIPCLQDVVLVESFLYNSIIEGSEDCKSNQVLRKIAEREYNTEIDDSGRSIIPIGAWFYRSYSPSISHSRVTLIRRQIRQQLSAQIFMQNRVNFSELSKAIARIGIDKCKTMYQQIFGNNHNSYSMTLYSGLNCLRDCLGMCHTACLYTGDYKAKGKFAELKRFYTTSLKRVYILQVPHHGSEHNINNKLYYPARLCIISAGVTDKYGHPDQQTLVAIQNQRGIPIIVTEDPKTIQVFTYHIP